MSSPRIAVVGAGAVGSYFGSRLAEAGLPVVLVGRPAHVAAINRHGLRVRTLKGERLFSVDARTRVDAVAGSQIVLVTVKTPDTESTARSLAPHLDPGAIVVSLQNGVDNAERMHRAAGISALAAVVYVAVQLVEPGLVEHTGRGDLILGDPLAEAGIVAPRPDALKAVNAVFVTAQVPSRVSDRGRSELWTKLAMNCGYNAISALTGARYGALPGMPGAAGSWSRCFRKSSP